MIVEIGTGSGGGGRPGQGAPRARIVAADISRRALAVARGTPGGTARP